MGVFIQIQIDHAALNEEMTQALVHLCPVDIFTMEAGRLAVTDEDECTLCELCLDAAPAGAIRIYKTYRDETLVSRG
jgi:NAD-dependent dihydropyrimidine dehydrogenase PreA subunit